jgi:hypothetical protein
MLKQSRSYQRNNPSKEIHQGRQRAKKKTERQPITVVDWMKLNTKMIIFRLAVHEQKNRIKNFSLTVLLKFYFYVIFSRYRIDVFVLC